VQGGPRLDARAARTTREDLGGLDASLGKLYGDAADFLNRPTDEDRLFVVARGSVFLGAAVALA